MTPAEKLTAQAALDVAIERLCTFHPANQIFIFGRAPDVLWTHFEPTAEELQLLSLGRMKLSLHEKDLAPLVVKGASGHFTAMVLDAERTLFAVVCRRLSRNLPSETRVAGATKSQTTSTLRS